MRTKGARTKLIIDKVGLQCPLDWQVAPPSFSLVKAIE